MIGLWPCCDPLHLCEWTRAYLPAFEWQVAGRYSIMLILIYRKGAIFNYFFRLVEFFFTVHNHYLV